MVGGLFCAAAQLLGAFGITKNKSVIGKFCVYVGEYLFFCDHLIVIIYDDTVFDNAS